MKLGLAPLASLALCAIACSSGSTSDLLPGAAPANASDPSSSASSSSAPPSSEPTSSSASQDSPSGANADASTAAVPLGATDASPGDAIDPEAAYVDLPVSAGGDAPIVSALSVKCAQSRSELDAEPTDATFPAAFVRVVGITDPQGVSDLLFGSHQLVLFASVDGSGAQARTFDAGAYGAYFGLWELGTYFAGNTAVLSTLCARTWWPAEITVTDASGHVTKAKVRVPVVR